MELDSEGNLQIASGSFLESLSLIQDNNIGSDTETKMESAIDQIDTLSELVSAVFVL